MSRPTFDAIYMSLAHYLGERSTCSRLQVGAVITSTDYRYVYGVGYNGNARGFDNACDSETPGACGCLHAEDNAVINCNAAPGVAKLFYCTHLPCVMCAKRIINLGGVVCVYYASEYRSLSAIPAFERAGIKLVKST